MNDSMLNPKSMTYMGTVLKNVKELEAKINKNKKATQDELDFLQDEFKLQIMKTAEKLRNMYE